MNVLYLIPIVWAGTMRGPKYFAWRGHTGIECYFSMMDYGFTPCGLLVAKDILQADQDYLALQSDVFRFPDNLDGPVDQDVQSFFAEANLPTNWMTPATTWRELLRQTAGMFQFNQRYGGIAAAETNEIHSIFDTATLSTRLRQMTVDEQRWFLATVESFGFDPALVSKNSQLSLLVKNAGDYWIGQTFYLGGMEF